jgi:toxin YoeB
MMLVRGLVFDPVAFEDLEWWVREDRKKALRIMKLIQQIQASPFEGIGKPESLKHELSGCWSRRIDDEHRLVYQVQEDLIRILACKYHY